MDFSFLEHMLLNQDSTLMHLPDELVPTGFYRDGPMIPMLLLKGRITGDVVLSPVTYRGHRSLREIAGRGWIYASEWDRVQQLSGNRLTRKWAHVYAALRGPDGMGEYAYSPDLYVRV